MEININSWANWYGDKISIEVDKGMLSMIARQYHIEIAKALDNCEYGKAKDLCETIQIIEEKLNDAERETEE